jgi:hypothetical protein
VANRLDTMIARLRTRTAGQVSAILADRLEGHLKAAGDDDHALRLAIDKIRVSLRLFVDADLAEAVAEELHRVGKL